MRRRIAVVGDTLTGGGQVLDYGPEFGFLFLGHKAALIGNKAYCETCKSVGVMAKSGGSSRMFDLTQEIALDGDFVLCQCPEHPRIKASLAGESWCEDGDSGAASSAEVAKQATVNTTSDLFDEQVLLVDNVTGQPLADYPYRFLGDDGTLVEGRTDANGRTIRVRTNTAVELDLEDTIGEGEGWEGEDWDDDIEHSSGEDDGYGA